MEDADVERDIPCVFKKRQRFRNASARSTCTRQNVGCKTCAKRCGDQSTRPTDGSNRLRSPSSKYPGTADGHHSWTKASFGRRGDRLTRSTSESKRLYNPDPQYPRTADGHHPWTKLSLRSRGDKSTQSTSGSKPLYNPNSPYLQTAGGHHLWKKDSARTALDPMLSCEAEPTTIRRPETRSIPHEQMVTEVKGIYAGLVMVEAKCVGVEEDEALAAQKSVSNLRATSTNEQWQALIALYKPFLHKHHDFFLASQPPSASPAPSRLAAKYSMPVRMWSHGIHSFLEDLRHRLPPDLDHMLHFIYIAYPMMALLYETLLSFEDTWLECLGDLVRYRMAIEDDDIRDREVWSGVARFWYSKAADKSPNVGRLYHHLAILARPNTLQQQLLYTRSLTCVIPLGYARDSANNLFNSIKLTLSIHLPSWSTPSFPTEGNGAPSSSEIATRVNSTTISELESDVFSLESLYFSSALASPRISSKGDNTASVDSSDNGANVKRYYKKAESASCAFTASQRLFRGLLGKLSLFGLLHLVHATRFENPHPQNPNTTAIAPFGSFVSSHLELLFPVSCCIFVPVSLIVASKYSRPHVYGCMMGVSSIVLLSTADNTSMSALASTT